jgi:pimeloyl-ACP methyl ester carboxylesterase
LAERTIRGLRFHVQRLGPAGATGRATAVVFLHGLVMDNLSSWFFTVANAVAERAPVVLYDLRGHGKSERPARGYGLDEHVADLLALLDGEQIDRAILVGNSFGGLLALAFARTHAERVAAVCLVDAHLGDSAFGAQMAETLSLEGEARDRRIGELFASWLGRNSERKRSRLAENASALVHGTSLVADLAATPPLALDGVDVPILALYGETSDLRARGEAILRGLPRAAIEIVPGCTHSILWEATATIRSRIVKFVDGVEVAR